MSTLSSSRRRREPSSDGETTELGDSPALYDFADEDGGPSSAPPAAQAVAPASGARHARRRADGQQLEIDLGPRRAAGPVEAAAASYLTRSNTLELDRAEVQARGRVLEDSLASHGVETSWSA